MGGKCASNRISTTLPRTATITPKFDEPVLVSSPARGAVGWAAGGSMIGECFLNADRIRSSGVALRECGQGYCGERSNDYQRSRLYLRVNCTSCNAMASVRRPHPPAA